MIRNITAALFALFTAGCALLKLHQENVEYSAATVLVGRVLPDGPWRGPVSVAAIKLVEGKPVVEHEVWLHEPGGFELIVTDGSYTLVAYGDSNNDGRPDDDAPAGMIADTVDVARSGLIPLLDIAIRAGAQSAVRAELPPEHRRPARPSSAAGVVVDFDDSQFSAASGKSGYWAPLEFFRTIGGNIYFAEAYDPKRTPVLFVHGATGSAHDWQYFIEHLDRTRFQAWVFQYPSGAPLEAMSHLLYWKLLNLRMRYGFTRLDLVAHSMGGLVTRRFLLDHGADFPQVTQFVSLSTPWGGQPMAARGVRQSPAVIPSWRDLQPEGAFLQSLFARPLPAGITHSLLYGHNDGTGALRPTSDGTISLASQLRPEARDAAGLVMGFDETHAGILSSAKVVSEVDRLFSAAEGNDGAAGGRLGIAMRHPHDQEPPAGIATLVMRRLDGDRAQRAGTVLLSIGTTSGNSEVGSLEPGQYEVRLAAAPFRARPDRQRIRIESGKRAQVRFDLEPEGMIIGEVLSESSRVDRPAGSYQRAEDAIRADSIQLEGPGGVRLLTPRREAKSSLLDAYLDGRNDASNQMFCFLGLAAGDYTLTVQAAGYETNVSRYRIVPGHHSPLPPVVMRKAAASVKSKTAR